MCNFVAAVVLKMQCNMLKKKSATAAANVLALLLVSLGRPGSKEIGQTEDWGEATSHVF